MKNYDTYYNNGWLLAVGFYMDVAQTICMGLILKLHESIRYKLAYNQNITVSGIWYLYQLEEVPTISSFQVQCVSLILQFFSEKFRGGRFLKEG